VTTIRHTRTSILAIMLAVAFYYRAWGILLQPRDFWHDEAFQYLLSLKPLSFIIAGNDVHPPLFNVLTKFMLYIGINDITMLRFIMVLFSMVFIAVFFWTIWDIFGKQTAIIATLAVSLMPTYAYYATEFRNYSFTLMLVILQIRYFNKLLRKDTAKDSLIFALLSTAMIYSHYLAGLILYTQVAYLLLTWTKKHYRFIPPMILTTVLSSPLVIYTILMISHVHSFWFKNIGLVSLISTFTYILVPPLSKPIGYGLFVYGSIIYCMIKFRHNLDKRHLQFGLYVVLPIITMWLISQVFPFYHHRYFLFGGIGVFVLFGWGFSQLAKKIKHIEQFAIAALIVLAFFSFSFFIATFNTELTDSSYALYNVTHNATDEFITIHSSTFSQSPYKVFFPTHRAYLVNNLTRKALFTAGGAVIADDEKYDTLQECLADHANETKYFVGTVPKGQIIYSKGGLYVSKI